jgi:hypothetical protein
LIITGDFGIDIFVYLNKSASKPKSLREAWIADYYRDIITLPSGANAFINVTTQQSAISTQLSAFLS